MERGSIQHGARLDDELKDGVEALVTGAAASTREREDLDPEAPAVEEMDPTADAMHGAIVERSELARWLLPSAFPGDAAALIAGALEAQAPEDVVATLRSLDPTAEYATMGDVWIALGHDMETRAHPEPSGAAPVSAAPGRSDAVIETLTEPEVEVEAEASPVVEILVQPVAGPRQDESIPIAPGAGRASALRRVLRLPLAMTTGAIRGMVDAAIRVLLDDE